MVTPSSPRTLALIPARGGSKSIPRKNIKTLGGVPLIAYSIAAGKQAARVDRVIVSTDDEEIAAVAREWGAEVPFLRPDQFAQDLTPDFPVFTHALAWLAEHEDYHPEVVVQLRPTSPFRPPDCVDRAVAMLSADPDADSVRGVVLSGQNPYKMWRLPQGEEGPMQPLLDEGFPESYNMPRQQLPVTYWQTGHIDAIRTRTILEQNSLSGRRIRPLILDSRYTIDIDNLWDWDRAEYMLERSQVPIVRPEVRQHAPLEAIKLLVLDFDGTLTDNRVWVDQDGRELIAASRGDGMGIQMLKATGVEVIVLSRETNPVVAARCRKIGIEAVQGILDKPAVLQRMVQERSLSLTEVAYIGNDVNDIGCMELVGCAVAVADSHPQTLKVAHLVMKANGGFGAVREFCDILLARRTHSS
ncbi:MAG: N-acylneuraminate cytidylyltransferase [Anaerolinea sp.]|nr:N-acylneuraminate cytidylyltransferase [Anaerolinea sp.]MCC6973434.1 N-acylneuraminate cytidylyltransferase [Anaerolineae bacterium]CAG1010582.1 N-acylneuraminate/3-deoxy-D-glycero-D-galacto-nononate cytidylyltransferase [Anaerolineae bacterium]